MLGIMGCRVEKLIEGERVLEDERWEWREVKCQGWKTGVTSEWVCECFATGDWSLNRMLSYEFLQEA